MTDATEITVKKGDIFFTAENSWLSKLILWAQREPGEEPSLVSHTGIFVDDGPLDEAEGVEALRKVRLGNIYERYVKHDAALMVVRDTTLTKFERLRLCAVAREWVGRKYGWWKLAFHLAHKLTGWDGWLRLPFIDYYPICSYLVAHAYATIGKDLGTPTGAAQPDDILDHALDSPQFEVIRPLRTLKTDKSGGSYGRSIEKNLRIIRAS